MEQREGHREEESTANSESFEILTFDPIAELAGELALCYIYIEQGIGGFCDWCTCQLKYHAGNTEDECEICGCYELYHAPLGPLVTLPAAKTTRYRVVEAVIEDESTGFSEKDRARDARAALKELTE